MSLRAVLLGHDMSSNSRSCSPHLCHGVSKRRPFGAILPIPRPCGSDRSVFACPSQRRRGGLFCDKHGGLADRVVGHCACPTSQCPFCGLGLAHEATKEDVLKYCMWMAASFQDHFLKASFSCEQELQDVKEVLHPQGYGSTILPKLQVTCDSKWVEHNLRGHSPRPEVHGLHVRCRTTVIK